MKTQFKILLLMLITSAIGYGQRHNILKESISVDKNSSIILNIENIYVAIEESTDGKIHFDYSIEFDGYSKKEIEKKLDEIIAEVSNFDNGVTLKAISKSQITFETFEFKAEHGISIDDKYFSKNKESIIRKSKDSLLKEMRVNNRLAWSKSPLKYINDRFKKLNKEGKLTNLRRGNIDIMRSQFVIKLPPFVKLNINSKNSGIYLRNDLPNELSIILNSGTFKTKALYHPYNRVKIEDANFETEAIVGGDFELKNIKNGKIGSIQKAKLKSEFSKVEIGEIDRNTTITDFNSEYWFYNWADKFERFNLYSEYSKIHFFYPEANHSFKVIGNNTKNLLGNGDFEINMQPTSKGEKYTMMVKEPNPNQPLGGRIFFDIVHGIIYSHNDSIKKINN